MTDFETHPAVTADLVKRVRMVAGLVFGDELNQAADRLEQLETQVTESGDFLAAYMAEAFTAGRTVTELTEALTRANAATAAAYEVAALAIMEKCHDDMDREEEAAIVRALATPDQTAALDRMIAEAVEAAAETAAQFVHNRLYEANMPACSYHSRDIKAAILAASKKGGA